MRYLLLFFIVFCVVFVVSQPYSCSNPFEVKICPSASFSGETVSSGVNSFNTWPLVFGIPITLNGAEKVYRIDFPPGSTNIAITVSGLTDNSTDGMGGSAIMLLKGGTCTSASTFVSFRTYSQFVTTTQNFNVTGQSSPLYFIMDHAESTPIDYNISFTASGYASLPASCATPIDLIYSEVDFSKMTYFWIVSNPSNEFYKVYLQYSSEGLNFHSLSDYTFTGNDQLAQIPIPSFNEKGYIRLKFVTSEKEFYSRAQSVDFKSYNLSYSNQSLSLSFNYPSSRQVLVYDLNGKRLFDVETDAQSVQFNLSLDKGVYLIRFVEEGVYYSTSKFIVE